MRFTLATAVLALAASSSASILKRQLPACATECIAGPDVDFGDCSNTDNACLCKSESFIGNATKCIEASCTGDELAAALGVAQQLCASVGVTLSPSATSDDAAPEETDSAAASDDAEPTSSGSAAKPSATSPTTSKPASSAASSTAASSSAAAPAKTKNAAVGNSANALAGLAAVGLAALAL